MAGGLAYKSFGRIIHVRGFAEHGILTVFPSRHRVVGQILATVHGIVGIALAGISVRSPNGITCRNSIFREVIVVVLPFNVIIRVCGNDAGQIWEICM